jgi:hypothetical protein
VLNHKCKFLTEQLSIAKPLAHQIADFIVEKELELEDQGENVESVLNKLAEAVNEDIQQKDFLIK